MQISNEQVSNIRRMVREGARQKSGGRVGSVEELAAQHGIGMAEVRRFTERALLAEEDPARERRVAELARRVEAGAYTVSSEDVVDMAERRALADHATDL